jgi:hypothetical protein
MKCKVCGETNDEKDFALCWKCSSPMDLTDHQAARLREKRSASCLSCPRCETGMRYAGLKKFHEGTRGWGFWLSDLGELFVGREAYDVYVCPRCGKVELFVDGMGDELRPDGRDGP